MKMAEASSQHRRSETAIPELATQKSREDFGGTDVLNLGKS
jgi:hypothetical protein